MDRCNSAHVNVLILESHSMAQPLNLMEILGTCHISGFSFMQRLSIPGRLSVWSSN